MNTGASAELTMLAGLVASEAAILIVSAAFCLILMRPQFGAYLYLVASPLIVGISRGDIIPARPNEFVLIFIAAALAVRGFFTTQAGEERSFRVSRVDLALVLLALTSSVFPLLMRILRDLPISSDDILYSIVPWKYLLVYCVFRASVSTASQVVHCLWLSMASAAVVAVIATLQVGGLFGVPEFLHTYYDQPFEGHQALMTERATSTIASAFGLADLMIMNLIIALALLQGRQSGRWVLMAASWVFLLGCIAAGQFSGIIGLSIALLVFGVISGRPYRVLAISVPAVVVASAVFSSVISTRLAGFHETSGIPPSWQGRLNNLQDYILPELFSGFNWLVGVRPAARLPAHETWREWVYIESGYVWLIWIGGIPLLAAFFYFAWVSGNHLWQIMRKRGDAVGVAAAAGFAYLIVMLTLMVSDPHLTLRGSADLFFPLLALSFVGARSSKYSRERKAPAMRTRAASGVLPKGAAIQ
jgi:hypothetical protein